MSKLILRKDISVTDLDLLVQNKHLGLPAHFNDREIYNILMDTGHKMMFREDPMMEILDIMSKPEYFYFTCKWLFGIELMPFQVLVLQDLWTRKFPMLVASRGFGKTFLLSIYAMLRAIFHQGCKIVVVGAAFRQSKLIFEYMETIWRNSPVLRNMIGSGKSQGPKRDIDRCNFYIGDSEISAIPMGDGCLSYNTLITKNNKFDYIQNPSTSVWGNGEFRVVDDFLDNGVKPTKIITTQRGFSFESTHNHKMKVCRNGQIVWVRADEILVGDRILIDRSERWHEGNFECSDEEAYTLGCMIGDGTWTNQYKLGFATIDPDHFIPYLNASFPKTWMRYKGDDVHWNYCSKQDIISWTHFWNLEPLCGGKNKVLPPNILSASQERMSACLSGLFDTDGTLQVSTVKGGTSLSVSFCNISKELVKQVQYILLHYGIVARVSSRKRPGNTQQIYELLMTGKDSVKFVQKIGFRLYRKQSIALSAIDNKIRHYSYGDDIPDIKQDMIDVTNSCHVFGYFPSLVLSKINIRNTMTHDYVASFLDKYKNVYNETLNNIRELSNPNVYYDKVVLIEDGESPTYDIHVPKGHEYCANGFFSHNSKIRGLRSNYTLVDEFSSLTLEVFEVVIKGFGAVSSSPTKRAENFARIKVLKSLGMYAEADDVDLGFGNQIVISGTAYYHFNHFYDYWLRYKQIIESKGETKKLEEIFHGEVPPNFDWRHYSIFRIPWTKLPPGFMDESLIGQTKATAHSTVYSMEFGATWSRDSDGFFRRSLIERCVCKEPIQLESGPVHFSAMTSGKPNCEYVYGIDPASEQDNFSIVILERHKDHRRIVYSWSIDRQKMRERITAKGRTSQKSFYAYCARKIRDLMKVFPTQHIGVDTQGGGIALMEALHDPSEYEPNTERPLWPWVRQGDKDVFWWEKPDKPTDGESGLHILHMVQFANADFMRDSNHGLRKDFESRIVIFPFFDTATIGEAISLDKLYNRQFDTMEDCVMEIEELKDELATIIHTQSAGGRDRWDTPEVKLPGNKKGHLRKDRYSALIIANMVARVMDNQLQGVQYSPAGAYVGQKKIGRDGPMYVGPQQYITKMGATGRCLTR